MICRPGESSGGFLCQVEEAKNVRETGDPTSSVTSPGLRAVYDEASDERPWRLAAGDDVSPGFGVLLKTIPVHPKPCVETFKVLVAARKFRVFGARPTRRLLGLAKAKAFRRKRKTAEMRLRRAKRVQVPERGATAFRKFPLRRRLLFRLGGGVGDRVRQKPEKDQYRRKQGQSGQGVVTRSSPIFRISKMRSRPPPEFKHFRTVLSGAARSRCVGGCQQGREGIVQGRRDPVPATEASDDRVSRLPLHGPAFAPVHGDGGPVVT